MAQLNEPELIKRLTPPQAIEITDLKLLPKDVSQIHILKISNQLIEPKYLKQIPNAKKLMAVSLTNNQLNTIPEDFFTLKNLLYFGTVNNPLKQISPSITNWEQIQFLKFNNTSLDSLPVNLAYCQKLIGIEIENNKSNSTLKIPYSFGYLKNIQLIQIHNTPCDTLPRSISNLQNLHILSLVNCSLKRLPKSIGKLNKLTELNLSNNQLQQLPESLYQLKNIETLILKNNPELSISPLIANLQKLQLLNIQGCKVSPAQLEEIKALLPQCKIIFDIN